MFNDRDRHFVRPRGVVFSLFQFRLHPDGFHRVNRFGARVIRLFGVSLPLALVPVLEVVVDANRNRVLIFGPELLYGGSSNREADRGGNRGSFFRSGVMVW